MINTRRRIWIGYRKRGTDCSVIRKTLTKTLVHRVQWVKELLLCDKVLLCHIKVVESTLCRSLKWVTTKILALFCTCWTSAANVFEKTCLRIVVFVKPHHTLTFREWNGICWKVWEIFRVPNVTIIGVQCTTEVKMDIITPQNLSWPRCIHLNYRKKMSMQRSVSSSWRYQATVNKIWVIVYRTQCTIFLSAFYTLL